MPEIKNQFTGGKMNKDLDERLVPKGEYRDAMNIQVSTSEGSDVGTVTNVLGNVPGCDYSGENGFNPISVGSHTVGSIADEKSDTLYWLIAGPKTDNLEDRFPLDIGKTISFKDIIMRTNSDLSIAPSGCEPVFVDKWKFCTGVDPGAFATTSNSIILDDNSLYSNITSGMYATGYNSTNSVFGPTLVTSVGTLNTLRPISYQNTTETVSLINPPRNVEFSLLFSENFSGGWSQISDNKIFMAPSWWLDPISSLVGETLVISSSTPTQSFEITGATMIVSTTLNGISSNVIEITLNNNITCFEPLCSDANFGPITTMSTGSGSCSTYNGSNISGAILVPPTITYNLTNIITISPNSPWLNEIYDLLYTYDTTTGISTPISGAQLTIDENFGAGITSFQPNSCIDPTSVLTGFDGTTTPMTFSNTFAIVECGTSTAFTPDPLFPNPTNKAIALTSSQTGINAVFLNDDVQLTNVDTICFESDKVLNLDSNRLITGVNIVDDMLFWTDNFSEPKKINIPRSIAGTDPLGDIHTAVVNAEIGLSLANYKPIREEHVTVIRKAPKSSLDMHLESSRDPDKNYSGIVTISDDVNTDSTSLWSNWFADYQSSSSSASLPYDFSDITTEEGSNIMRFVILTDLNVNSTFNLDDWKVGSKVVLKEFLNGVPPSIPIYDYTIKGHVTDWEVDDGTGSAVNANWFTSQHPTNNYGAKVAIKVTSISGTPSIVPPGSSTLNYAIDLWDESEKLYEFKLPRFSYRYKYEDGEYSTFAPWTNVGFNPGLFDYHPQKGYNLGMRNNINRVKLKGFVTQDIPLDVVEIDILYKEDSSPNVYIVDTISPKSEATIIDALGNALNSWQLNEFIIENENIKGVLPSNQLLRPWDNVPKKALAQEITGSRIVYGNYEQNYDLTVGASKYTPNFLPSLISSGSGVKSIKSLREYQLGVVFTDKYGRETPVISNNTGTFKIEKESAIKANKLQLSISNNLTPQDVEYFKFYIKQTSGEYYNMAMDRYWDAEDGNIWISFASSDRNKIDEDSFLILKKGVDSDELVEDPARFKVIAIENEAPDFIKIKKTIISDKAHDYDDPSSGINRIFLNDVIPTAGSKYFSLAYHTGTSHLYSNTSIKNLHNATSMDGDIYFQIVNSDGTKASIPKKIAKMDLVGHSAGANVNTSTYQAFDAITQTAGSPTQWDIVLEEAFGDDINKFTDDTTGDNPTFIMDGNRAIFWSYKKENSPEFDGRFFVKIFEEDIFTEVIVNNPTAVEAQNVYPSELSQKIYSFEKDKHSKAFNLPSPKDFPGNGGYVVSEFNSGGQPKWNHYIDATNETGDDFGMNGSNGTDWQSHAAFFRGLNVAKAREGTDGYQNDLDQHAINKRKASEKMDLHNYDQDSGDWVEFEDVWFINDEESVGSVDQWGGAHSTTNYTGDGIDLNSVTTGRIELGFGGIQPSTQAGINWPYATNPDSDVFESVDTELDDSFFDLNVNNNYSKANNFASLLTNGTIFGWVEDPTNQIYKVTGNNGTMNLLRHEHDTRDQSTLIHQVQHQQARLPVYDLGSIGVNALNLSDFNDGASQHSIINGIQYFQSTFYRPDNYSKNYNLTFTDVADPTLTVNTWNPYVTGVIANGLNIPITVTTGNTGQNNEITVSDLIGVDAIYGNQKITVGMVWDISDLPTGSSWSPDSTAGQGAVISEIIKNSTSSYTLRFKNYDGTKPDGTFPTLPANDVIQVKQFGMNGLSRNSAKNINYFNDGIGFMGNNHGVDAVGYTIDIKDMSSASNESKFPRFPAIFETEPKEESPLDIYYEISDNIPTSLTQENISSILPIGSEVKIRAVDASIGNNGVISGITILANNINSSGKEVVLSLAYNAGQHLAIGDKLIVTKLNGDILEIGILSVTQSGGTPNRTILELNPNLLKQKITSNWHNCYSFKNGVESNRIRDNFNQPYMLSGVKASTTLEQEYKKEHRKYGLIYSGLYNSTSGMNNLNQFVQAEKITKDINPTYGSIQKLHAGWGQSGDLLAFCEDRVLKILANKDALYNADGDTNITSTNNVLGTATPYSGEYGISKNPESFASESYRAYFSDKVRGSVMRLSMDGLTPISEAGMKDYFKDNLKNNNTIIGSYDDKKDEYNITLTQSAATISYKENVKGWVSFKSFIPENAISCANEYYTFKDAQLWKHHDETIDRNTFYGGFDNSTINVILNDTPGSVKSFHTLNYEGSQSKVTQFTTDPTTRLTDGEYYNLQSKDGWYVNEIKTNKQTGTIDEFIEKEGKWFNYIKGESITHMESELDRNGNPITRISIDEEGNSNWE